ncbi:MAG: ABC transporter permease subunit [Sporolactobacillus sp.]
MMLDHLTKKRLNSLGVLLLIIVITYGSMLLSQFSLVQGLTAFPKALIWSVTNFFPNADSFQHIGDILSKMQETLLMSIASSTVAAVFAFFFAIAGSRVTQSHSVIAFASRFIANIFRNIDVSIWSLVLLFSFGQSSLTGFFALFAASFGFLTRSIMETIDEVGPNAVEALRATGASYPAIIMHAVIPNSISQIISWMLFMIETNIRSATLVGILTGSGIGFIFDLYYKQMEYNTASLVVLAIVVSIIMIEQISNYVRRAML